MSLDTSNIISMTRKYVTYDDDEGDDIINSASNNNVRHGLESISQNGYSQKSNIFKWIPEKQFITLRSPVTTKSRQK